jgi:hypothetical protein
LVIVGLILITVYARSRKVSNYGYLPNNSSVSVSAVGYALFYELLNKNEFKVRRAMRSEPIETGPNELLVLTDPDFSIQTKPEILAQPNVLVILPKWSYNTELFKPNWVALVHPLPVILLSQGLSRATVPDLKTVKGVGKLGKLTVNPFGPELEPTFEQPVWLVNSPLIVPVLANEEGVLLGLYRDKTRSVWILADADLVANHGILKGQNLELALSFMDRIAPGQAVVFDESRDLSGAQKVEEEPGEALFPDLISYILLGLTSLMAVFAAGRFGPILETDEETYFGRRRLIENSSRLLERSGCRKVTVVNYLKMVIKSLAKIRHAPPGLTENELYDWLDRLEPKFELKKFVNEVRGARANTPEARQLFWAKKIYAWKARVESGSKSSRQHN